MAISALPKARVAKATVAECPLSFADIVGMPLRLERGLRLGMGSINVGISNVRRVSLRTRFIKVYKIYLYRR